MTSYIASILGNQKYLGTTRVVFDWDWMAAIAHNDHHSPQWLPLPTKTTTAHVHSQTTPRNNQCQPLPMMRWQPPTTTMTPNWMAATAHNNHHGPQWQLLPTKTATAHDCSQTTPRNNQCQSLPTMWQQLPMTTTTTNWMAAMAHNDHHGPQRLPLPTMTATTHDHSQTTPRNNQHEHEHGQPWQVTASDGGDDRQQQLLLLSLLVVVVIAYHFCSYLLHIVVIVVISVALVLIIS